MKMINQEKLILTLLVRDITAEINRAMRLRKISIKLDYTKTIPHLVVTSKLSQEVTENWMWANPRTRRSIIRPMTDPTLRSFQTDLEQRLWKMKAVVMFAAEKPFNKKAICKFQVKVSGVRNIVLTLADATTGTTTIDTAYQTPDGETP